MASRKLSSEAALRRDSSEPGAARVPAVTVLVFLVGAASILAFSQAPRALALPIVSVLLVVTGFALALVAYLRGLRSARGYDAAGILVLLGFAAALMADGDQTLALLEQFERQGLTALAE